MSKGSEKPLPLHMQLARAAAVAGATGFVALTLPAACRAYEAEFAKQGRNGAVQVAKDLAQNPRRIWTGVWPYALRQAKGSFMSPMVWEVEDIISRNTTLPLAVRGGLAGLAAGYLEMFFTKQNEIDELRKKFDTPPPSLATSRAMAASIVMRNVWGWGGAAFCAGYGREHDWDAKQQAEAGFFTGMVTGVVSNPANRVVLDLAANNGTSVSGAWRNVMNNGPFRGAPARALTIATFIGTSFGVKGEFDKRSGNTAPPPLSEARAERLAHTMEEVFRMSS